MAQITEEMPGGTMDNPKTTPFAPGEQNMGDVFRATAKKSTTEEEAPAVQMGKMPGEEEAQDEESAMGKMPGE